MNSGQELGNEQRELDPGPRLEMLEYRETGCFGGSGSLVLADRTLTVTGALPGWHGPRGPLKLTRMEIDSIHRVLVRRGVWEWKSEYSPGDCGEVVLDGREWELVVRAGGREHRSRGVNAYPAPLTAGLISPRPGFLRQMLHGIARVIVAP